MLDRSFICWISHLLSSLFLDKCCVYPIYHGRVLRKGSKHLSNIGLFFLYFFLITSLFMTFIVYLFSIFIYLYVWWNMSIHLLFVKGIKQLETFVFVSLYVDCSSFTY